MEKPPVSPFNVLFPTRHSLGPALFLPYTNDLPDDLTYSKLRLFADDSIIYKPVRSQSDCEKLHVLEAAAKWERDWLMVSHPDKCTVLSITQNKRPLKHSYTLHDHQLETVTSTKYIDITLQSNLKWNKHINDITSNGSKRLGFLRRNLKTTK